MNRRLALALSMGLAVATTGPLAWGQQGAAREEVTIGYQGLPYKASGETPNGIQLSEGVLMHVGAGAEAGYDTNVFYQESNRTSSSIYRTSLFTQISNASRGGTVSKQVAFDARAGFQYRRYQSENPNLDGYRNAFMPTAGLSLSVGSGQVGFGLANVFIRLEDPPYSVGQSMITRYNNQASVEGRWSPGGGRLTGLLRYTNMIDVFDNIELRYANSMTNMLMLDFSWKWLPKTALFVNAQQGYIFYFREDAELNGKFSSFPLRLTTGLRGLLTERLSAVVAVGYVNAFYTNGATTGGFLGSSFAEASVMVRPTLTSRIVVGFRHDFTNSVIAAFSYDDAVYASYVQQLAGRLALDISGRYVHRNYQGFLVAGMPVPRDDNYFHAGATLDYFVRNWMYAGVGYALMANDSNLPLGTGVPAVNYVKQQMFVRLGITY